MKEILIGAVIVTSSLLIVFLVGKTFGKHLPGEQAYGGNDHFVNGLTILIILGFVLFTFRIVGDIAV